MCCLQTTASACSGCSNKLQTARILDSVSLVHRVEMATVVANWSRATTYANQRITGRNTTINVVVTYNVETCEYSIGYFRRACWAGVWQVWVAALVQMFLMEDGYRFISVIIAYPYFVI